MQGPQLKRTYDIAVVGSGFAGSLIAMIAQRLGRSVVLLERNKHPRVVIGESSTPLSNLLLEDLALRYDLPRILPLSKWGSWQKEYPQIGCGLKRGFSFYYHQLDKPDIPDPDRLRQLLVAASPHNQIADTHWYRADFDEMLVGEAQKIGVDYFDEVKLDSYLDVGHEAILRGKHQGGNVSFHAKFVIDATGPRGFLHNTLHLSEASLSHHPRTQALFSHFSNVGRLENVSALSGSEIPPYPIDDAAVHHIFDGGWIWVLQFNNGITSAGVAATEKLADRLLFADGAPAWQRLLNSIPVLKQQFNTSNNERPFTHVKSLSFLSETMHSARWTLLPSAAGFIDPLLSTGFPLTLLGISRLASIIESDWGSLHFQYSVRTYATQTMNELLTTAKLISSLYANMNNFSVFSALTLLYFAAASFSEAAHRLKKTQLASSFLLQNDATFGTSYNKLLERALHLRNNEDSVQLINDILHAIEPIDVAGLCNRQQRNWYPVKAEDLVQSAHKLNARPEEITHLLRRSGF